MEHLTDAVRQAVQQRNWYAALGLALTLPDICGRIEEPQRQSKARYVDWCGRYLSPRLAHAPSQRDPVGRSVLAAEDCYALRCAVLHEGVDEIVEQQARKALQRFRFVAPGKQKRVMLLWALSAGTLQLQTDLFCEAICEGVDDWLVKTRRDNPVAAARVDALMKIEPWIVKGLEPE